MATLTIEAVHIYISFKCKVGKLGRHVDIGKYTAV